MVSIEKLRKEKKKLMQEKKKLMAERKKLMMMRKKSLKKNLKAKREKAEFQKLKNEVKQLKRATSSSLFAKTRRYVNDPATKKKMDTIKKRSKSAWSKFQDFADKYGES